MALELFAAVPQKEKTPGPGAYEEDPLTAFGQSYKFTIRPRYPDKLPFSPNVDYPENLTSFGGPSYTIGHKYKPREIEQTPGPNYMPDSKDLFSRSVKIKNCYKDINYSVGPGPSQVPPRDWPPTHVPVQGGRGPIVLGIVPDSPGPAAYSTRPKTGESSPKTAIRPRTAPPARRDKMPGLEYNELNRFGKDCPKYTIPRSTSRTKDNGVPGPGAYDPDPFLPEKVRKIKTSIGSRFKERKYDVYDPPLEDTREFPKVRNRTIPKSGWPKDRDVATVNCQLFLPDSTLDRKALTIGNKFPPRATGQTPGPADYYPEHSYSSLSTGFSVKGPETRDAWLTSDTSIPGPGAYSVNRDEPGIQWTIGDRSRGSSRRSNRSAQSYNYSARRSSTRNTARSRMSSSREGY